MSHQDFKWESTTYEQAPTFIEIYDGFTMDVAGITIIKKYQYKPIGKFKPQWYVVVNKKDEQIEIIETEDKSIAEDIYKKLCLIAKATSDAYTKATHEVETTISHESEVKCET